MLGFAVWLKLGVYYYVFHCTIKYVDMNKKYKSVPDWEYSETTDIC